MHVYKIFSDGLALNVLWQMKEGCLNLVKLSSLLMNLVSHGFWQMKDIKHLSHYKEGGISSYTKRKMSMTGAVSI